MSRYPGNLSNNLEWRKIWQAIPKFVWWKVWLARNELIFNSKPTKPEIVVAKAKAMLLEVVGNKFKIDPIKFIDEHNWLGLLQQDKIHMGYDRPFTKPNWLVRLPEKNFQNGGKEKIKSQSSLMERQKETREKMGQGD